MINFNDWSQKQDVIKESVDSTRYSIGINYRTTKDEALEAYAKIVLGFVSASMKQHNYHTKHVYSEKPLRLLVASRNWDSGEWVGCVTWNQDSECFIISSGYWNKERRSISIQKSEKCKDSSANEISKTLYNLMNDLKNKPDNYKEKLKPVSLKRGPKS